MIEHYTSLLSQACQMVLVETENWDSIHANIKLFERNNIDREWVETGVLFSVVLGKNGLAYDPALREHISESPIPPKKEGDHKAPIGIFSIDSAFGYADRPEWMQMPYRQCTDSLKCVDDPHSAFYNRFIDKNTVAKDWNSAEDMLRKDDLYKWGLVIGYNTQNPVPGCGSCIFMHIWRSENEGTEGCTAMSEDNMLMLLNWLRAEKKPILVQGIKGLFQI